jgi:hypothetical protein
MDNKTLLRKTITVRTDNSISLEEVLKTALGFGYYIGNSTLWTDHKKGRLLHYKTSVGLGETSDETIITHYQVMESEREEEKEKEKANL